MGQAWRSWDTAPVIEDRGAACEPQEVKQLLYQTVFREGKQVQREFRRDGSGEEYETMAREVSHVLGSGIQGRTYVWSVKGYLRIMPLGWYSAQDRYDMSPDYRERNLRFDRTVGTRCMSCHNAMVPYVPGSGHAYAEPLPSGLGCQRCHGPGANHIASYSGSPSATASRDLPDEIVNPADLPFDRQQDVCLQCHLSGTISLPQPGCDFWSFRPGMRLRDVRSDFIDAAQADYFSAVGHGPRSMASACYQKSGGRMTCIFCHNPHYSTRETPVSHYNQRCMDCHQAQPCTRPLPSGERAETGNCVHCHMPQRRAHDIPHAVATEHWIQRNPEESDDEAREEERAQSEPLVPFWPDTSDGQLGSALVEYYGDRRQVQEVQRGMTLLHQELARQGSIAEWQYRLGLGYYHSQQWSRAAEWFERAERSDPNLVEAAAGLGETLLIMGQRTRGIEQLEQLLERRPFYYRSDVTLVRAYWETEQLPRMLEMEQKYLERHPDEPERLEFVARAMDRLGRPFDQTRAVVQRAIDSDGLRVFSRLLLAQMAMRHDKPDLAEEALRGAVAANPESSEALSALTRFLVTHGRRLEARAELQKALNRDPSHAEARRLFRQFSFE
jgi:tetratricopeptide (TPR) repeat protein